jgi:hypothetical protein
VRAYLGKGYFEAKRIGLDEREYGIAQQSDPLDPTAWLYDAIAKQTTNRPVEALQSIQKSIELNDNRAVFRSRLMLDEDLAVRSASLGRVYSDLGCPSSLSIVRTWPMAAAASARRGSGSIRLGAGGSATDSNRGSALACTTAEAGVPGGDGSPTSMNS